MITIGDAIRCVNALIDYVQDNDDYSEFEDDLYSLLDALNEDKHKAEG